MQNKFTVDTYDPSDVTLIIGGYQIKVWESISIARSAPGFVTIRGIRGKNTRVRQNDTSAVIQVPILQTSPSNGVLSEIHSLDLQNGTGRIGLALKDSSGRSVFSSDEAYIVGYPETVFSGTFEYRVWNIFCQTTKSFRIAGNSRPSTSLFDSALSSISDLASRLL